MNVDLDALFKLGRAERIQLVEDLWDSIEREGLPQAVSQEKEKELWARKERFQKNPDSGLTWEQVKANARSNND